MGHTCSIFTSLYECYSADTGLFIPPLFTSPTAYNHRRQKHPTLQSKCNSKKNTFTSAAASAVGGFGERYKNASLKRGKINSNKTRTEK